MDALSVLAPVGFAAGAGALAATWLAGRERPDETKISRDPERAAPDGGEEKAPKSERRQTLKNQEAEVSARTIEDQSA